MEIKKWTVLCEKKKTTAEKRVGSLLTYDTALQVVAGTAQQDFFLNLGLLGRHFSRFLLFAGVEATEERGAEKVGGGGGGGKAEAGTGMARGKSRTSCGSIDDTKEKDGRSGKRRDGECPQGQWARSIINSLRIAGKRVGNVEQLSIKRSSRCSSKFSAGQSRA